MKLVVALALLIAAPATAAPAGAYLGTPSDTTIPTSGALYFYAPGDAAVEVSGPVARVHVEHLAESVGRITYRGAPGTLTVTIPAHGVAATYHLASGAPDGAPDAPAPRVVRMPAGWNPMRGLDDALWLALGGGGVLVLGCALLLRRRPELRES